MKKRIIVRKIPDMEWVFGVCIKIKNIIIDDIDFSFNYVIDINSVKYLGHFTGKTIEKSYFTKNKLENGYAYELAMKDILNMYAFSNMI